MTKMKMPKMDIIRFNESDVIVASGGVVGKTLSINGIGDGKTLNGMLTLGGQPFASEDLGYESTLNNFISYYNDYMAGDDTWNSERMLYGNNGESGNLLDIMQNDGYSWRKDPQSNSWASTNFIWNDGWHAQ